MNSPKEQKAIPASNGDMKLVPVWYVYIVRCRDQSLYTGITTDIKRRFREHAEHKNRCAKYLRGRSPLKLVYTKKVGTRSQALKAEYKLKRLSKAEKRLVVLGKKDNGGSN
jgi:putative endonuclease